MPSYFILCAFTTSIEYKTMKKKKTEEKIWFLIEKTTAN